MRIGQAVAAAFGTSGLYVAASLVVAEPVRRADAALQSWVAGSDFAIDAPLGSVIRVSFAPDGTMTGSAGGMGWALGASNDTGRWWVAADKLCKRWSVWFDAKTRCVEIRTEGERIFWRDGEGRDGTATRTASRPVAPPATVAAPLPIPQRQQIARAETAPSAASPPDAPSTLRSAPANVAPKAAPVASAPMTPAERAAARLVPPAPTPVARARPQQAEPARAQPQAVTSARSEPAEPDTTAARAVPPRRDGVPLLRVVNVEPDDVLWVRQGPGTEHEEIGSLQPNGRGIELVGPCTGDWCRISYRGLRGWASRHYLMADGLATTTR